MAITSAPLFDSLKTYYAKNGVTSLLYKNSPTLEKVEQDFVSGKTANFAALYARSAGVGSNLLAVEAAIAKTGRVKEFAVTPANMFAGESFGEKELLASRDNAGAYLPIAELKMFNACEGYRKNVAQAFFGDGTGYICDVPATDADGASFISLANNAEVTFLFEIYQTMYIDIGTSLKFKTSRTAADDSNAVTFEVTAIDGKKVTIKNVSGSTYSYQSGDVISIAGAISTSGTRLIPTGLAGWLPKTVTAGENFFGIDRSIARDRLAGSHLARDTGNNEKIYEVLQRAIAAVRRYGSKADMIVMNDEDYLTMAAEIEAKTTFQKVNGGTKGKAQIGYDGFGFSVITNFLDQIIPDQYCPKGTAYVLDSQVVRMWAFNDASKIMKDGIGLEPGKPAVVSSDADKPLRPHQMLVDNIFTIKDGVTTEDGNASIVEISTFFNFVVTNPAVCASVEL